ncbi:valine--tRNA ligase [Sphingomonas sp.]|uniref:valine--tRNA ligase n=1 Tax=Sphingomonas sp. TaxID=28214 RepID=UPI0018002B4D|nr:valine--tRNA ligase [Sphingomonas sp.]MBA3511603.1 valine--tRNA ligase [Sphingomonas sp.]
MTSLAKTFEPGPIEQRWYEHWETRGLFRPDRGDAEPWTIVMPPPNVTGSLHIGHALDNTLQDILTRHARMRGRDARWVVGMDHAGIATQMVVERQLEERQDKRTNYTRDEFVSKVWEWKEESGGQITRQLRRLGASCDWAHERFTMDDGFRRAVTHAFVELYRRGLAYRDKRLVNWDPKFQSAISDLEVETREVHGHFWHLKYPLAEGDGHVSVATTRPETMLADMAVAVHPDDERYRALVGKAIRHPITGRLIPIIADEHADPELGSGAVKITPGHDFNDFEVGKRAGFKPAEMLNMFDAEARLVQTADGLIPGDLIGLDRFEARKRVVAMLESEGVLEKVEERVIPTPFGDRSGAVIEPWLTDQWYVDAAKLAAPVLEATRSGAIKIVPKTWEKTWFNWLENIQPWCVSRQLWWGHRIPAWFDEDGKVFVAETEEEAQREADDKTLQQDDDVLDTWFSSALWPFATLGWPDETDELKRHYPNDVLISGFDILFFWDARMAMQGLEFMNEVPWRTLYLHGLVRDAVGQKMSKSKGNTVDPLGLIDRYGADALRFTLAAMESQGRDIKLEEKRVEGYRNFATKLWNAARFLQMNGVGASQSIAAPQARLPVNRWIIGEVVETLAKLDRAFDELRFDDMADSIYHFTWGTFCDWYVELVKGAFDDETRAVAAWAFDQILVMLHPFMPFVTEELWHAMPRDGDSRPYELILAKWPAPEAVIDRDAMSEIDWLITLVSETRSARMSINVPPAARTDLWVLAEYQASEGPRHTAPPTAELVGRVERNRATLARMARLNYVTFFNTGVQFDLRSGERFDRTTSERPIADPGIQVVAAGNTYFLPLQGLVDFDAERTRLADSLAATEKERDSLAARLDNPAFTERAKPEAVEKARSDHAERAAEAERLAAALARLG